MRRGEENLARDVTSGGVSRTQSKTGSRKSGLADGSAFIIGSEVPDPPFP